MTREEYEAKRQARYDRLIAAAERAQSEGTAKVKHGWDMFGAIPMGQPILIGHHSEKRDRNYRNRADGSLRKGYALQEQAAEYRSRAQATENNDAIYSDNPDAGELITDKVAKLEKLLASYKAVNAAYKKFIKDPASLDQADLADSTKKLIREWKPEYSWDKGPIASFTITNLSANIRRYKERAQIVEKKQALEDTEKIIGDIKIEFCPADNRIRIHYPGRVSAEVFKSLRSAGFRVAKSFGDYVFSAYYNNSARWFVEQIKEEVTA